MNYPFLHFLNYQYWYCAIYSLFGGECTADALPRTAGDIAVGIESATTTSAALATTTVSGEGGGFFSTLFNVGSAALHVVLSLLIALWSLYSIIAYTISVLLILAIVGSLLGLIFIRYRELSLYGTLPPEVEKVGGLGTRWQELLRTATTTDPKRWREAILEADVMLGELFQKLGYAGNTTAERLRNVPESAFVTLPQAWEAHRIKNFVAARSSDFILTQREAFRVMKLYEQVFEEFNFI